MKARRLGTPVRPSVSAMLSSNASRCVRSVTSCSTQHSPRWRAPSRRVILSTSRQRPSGNNCNRLPSADSLRGSEASPPAASTCGARRSVNAATGMPTRDAGGPSSRSTVTSMRLTASTCSPAASVTRMPAGKCSRSASSRCCASPRAASARWRASVSIRVQTTSLAGSSGSSSEPSMSNQCASSSRVRKGHSVRAVPHCLSVS